MKLLLPILLLSICSHAQKRLVEISREYVTVDIHVTDGMIYKYKIPSDSARYFNPGPDKYEAIVTFKKLGVVLPPPIITVIDNMVNTTYTGSWVTGKTSAPGWHEGTISYSDTKDDYLEFKFTGVKVELWAEIQPVNGDGAISIDGGPEVIVSFKSTTKQLPVLIYTSPNLALKEHTLKLRCVGNGYVMSDFFKVYK